MSRYELRERHDSLPRRSFRRSDFSFFEVNQCNSFRSERCAKNATKFGRRRHRRKQHIVTIGFRNFSVVRRKFVRSWCTFINQAEKRSSETFRRCLVRRCTRPTLPLKAERLTTRRPIDGQYHLHLLLEFASEDIEVVFRTILDKSDVAVRFE